jgi:hypothetical protein
MKSANTGDALLGISAGLLKQLRPGARLVVRDG